MGIRICSDIVSGDSIHEGDAMVNSSKMVVASEALQKCLDLYEDANIVGVSVAFLKCCFYA